MKTLLVLGSKPDPMLPPRETYDEVACANASGFSAARHALPAPIFTVVSAILTTGIGSGKQSLRAMSGLRTRTLHFYPRPPASGSFPKLALRTLTAWRARPFWFERSLRSAGFQWDELVLRSHAEWRELLDRTIENDAEATEQIGRKQPSTGLMAIVLGVATGWERIIVSGFSFELTHAYAHNVEIDARGTRASRHIDTDVLVLRALVRRHGNVFTTEPAVHERAGVPWLPLEGATID